MMCIKGFRFTVHQNVRKILFCKYLILAKLFLYLPKIIFLEQGFFNKKNIITNRIFILF